MSVVMCSIDIAVGDFAAVETGNSIDANCSPFTGLHPRPDRLEQLSSNIGTSENMLMRVYSKNDAKTEASSA
eukprot:gene14805-10587_t